MKRFIFTLMLLLSSSVFADEPTVEIDLAGVLAQSQFLATNAVFYPDEYTPNALNLTIVNTEVEVGSDGSCSTKMKYNDKVYFYFPQGLPVEKEYNFPEDILSLALYTSGTLEKNTTHSRLYRQRIEMGTVTLNEVVEESHISGTMKIRGLNPVDELEGKFRAKWCTSFKIDFGS